MIFLLLTPFLIQPILIRIYARKAHDCAGIRWALLAFGINIVVFALFESRIDGRLVLDAAAEISTTTLISTVIVVGLITTLSGSPELKANENSSINYSQGVLRISMLISGAWILHCMIVFLQICDKYGCAFPDLERTSSWWQRRGVDPYGLLMTSYIEIGEWFLKVPAVAFGVGVGVCWAIAGFRQPRLKNRAETVLLLTEVVEPPEPSKQS